MRSKTNTNTPKAKRRLLRGILLYTSAVAFTGMAAFYFWLPFAYDIFPKEPPPREWIDPDESKLFSKGTKVLVITAHPDDSEFYAGPLLMRLKDSGAKLDILLHTDGDKGFYFWEDNSHLRAIRRKEQTEACNIWGAQEIVFLGHPDGRLQKTREVVTQTTEMIARIKPDYILTFDTEYPFRRSHRDHRVTGQIVNEAMKDAGYRGWALKWTTRAANYVADCSAYAEWQAKLVMIHKSQFAEKEERIVGMTERRRREDGSLKGFDSGVAFRATKF